MGLPQNDHTDTMNLLIEHMKFIDWLIENSLYKHTESSYTMQRMFDVWKVSHK